MAVSNSAKQTHQGFLRAMIRDERLTPSKKLLAEMLLLMIEGAIPLTLIEDVWGNPKRIKWATPEDGEPQPEPNDTVNVEARRVLSNLFAELQQEENNASSEGRNG